MACFELVLPIILLAWCARSSEPLDHHRPSRQTDVACVFEMQTNGSVATCQGSTLADLQPEALQEDAALLWALTLLSCSLPALPPAALEHMPALQELTIFSSSLSNIESGSFRGIENLLRLNLSHNELENLDRRYFSLLKDLKSLTLRANRITSVKGDSFSGVSVLQFLDLSENLLETLPPAAFRPTPGLVKINLSRNQIERLPPRLFAGLPNLTSVDLTYNKLMQLPPKMFDNVPNLQKLMLSNNNLRALNPEIFNQPQRMLRLLNLDSNELVLLDVKTLQTKLPALIKVVLSPNPWSCSCLRVVLDWMNGRRILYQPAEYFEGRKPVCSVLQSGNVLDSVTGKLTNQSSVTGCDALTEQQAASLRTTYRNFGNKVSEAIRS